MSSGVLRALASEARVNWWMLGSYPPNVGKIFQTNAGIPENDRNIMKQKHHETSILWDIL
jgi:hypothetical protein